jgi:hypothetical protein
MEVVNVSYLGSKDQYQSYAPQDVALINTAFINGSYGSPGDYIEYFIKDLSGNVLSANYYATQYELNNSVVDPLTGKIIEQKNCWWTGFDCDSPWRSEGFISSKMSMEQAVAAAEKATGGKARMA